MFTRKPTVVVSDTATSSNSSASSRSRASSNRVRLVVTLLLDKQAGENPTLVGEGFPIESGVEEEGFAAMPDQSGRWCAVHPSGHARRCSRDVFVHYRQLILVNIRCRWSKLSELVNSTHNEIALLGRLDNELDTFESAVVA